MDHPVADHDGHRLPPPPTVAIAPFARVQLRPSGGELLQEGERPGQPPVPHLLEDGRTDNAIGFVVAAEVVTREFHKVFEAVDDDRVGQRGLSESGEGGEVRHELREASRVDELEPVRRGRPLVLQQAEHPGYMANGRTGWLESRST